MRDHSHHIELTREEAVAAILKATVPPEIERRIEHVPVGQSYGRVLACNVTSRIDVPGALTCNMDSIAVHWAAFEDLSEGALPDTTDWQRGIDWEFANTGVAMPEGFDTAIVIEHVRVSEDEQHVQIDAAPSARFAGTRAPGSKRKAGDVVAFAGEVVTPDVAARVAGANVASVPVVRKPRVAFIPTGDELVVPGSAHVPADKNIETNSLLARGKVEAWGGDFVPFDIVPDDPAQIEQAVKRAVAMADIVVLNAGSSKGSADWSIEELEKIGAVLCHETNHGPGHHSSFAVVDATPVVGISGPPAGASFTLDFYLLPLMRRWLGLDPVPAKVPAKLTADLPARGPHGGKGPKGGHAPAGEDRPFKVPEAGASFFGIRFLNVTTGSDGTLLATPVGGRPGSMEAERANAFFMCPTGGGIPVPTAGDVIEIEFRNPGLASAL